MTDSSSTNDQRRRDYLSRVLRMNPHANPQAVLALRRRALGIKPAVKQQASTPDPESRQKAQAIRRYVERIQAEFWTLPLEELKRSLSAIDLRQSPELRPLVARLRTVAACRSEFPKLASAPNADLGLVHAFKSAVVRPPAEAGPVRERFLKSIEDRQHLRNVRRMVLRIRNEHPMLYELERDWFETILKQKRAKARREDSGFELSVEFSWPVFVGIMILIRILLVALR